jgi:hypothetical protein
LACGAGRVGSDDPAALPPAERVNHQIYRAQLDGLAGDIELGGYLMPMNSDSAFYSELACCHVCTPFRDARMRNYIARLRAIPSYFAQNIELLKSGLKRGMTVPPGGAGRARWRDRRGCQPEGCHRQRHAAQALPAGIDADTAEQLRREARAASRRRSFPRMRSCCASCVSAISPARVRRWQPTICPMARPTIGGRS